MAEKTVTGAEVAEKVLDKTEILITKVAEKATDIFDAAAGIVTAGVEKYGQQAIDAVLWVVRIDGIQTLVTALAFLIAYIVLMYYTLFRKAGSGSMWSNEAEPLSIVISLIATAIAINVAVIPLTNVWNYVAVVKPELYLVKKTIDIVEKKFTAPPAQK